MYEDYYRIIEKSYDNNTYYEDYRKNRQLTEKEKWLLDLFMHEMPGKNVLDIGCGDARLFDVYLAEKCTITGIDISARQVQHAKENMPYGCFIHGNFLDNIEVREYGMYAGILCMYAIFNFMEEDQLKALQKMYELLMPNGVVLMNIRKERTNFIKYSLKWCGDQMYWSLPGVTRTLEWCTSVGFSCRVYENTENPDYVFAILTKL